MKSIIERELTFENNSNMEVKVTQKQLLRAFVKETHEARYAQQSNPLHKPNTEEEPILEVICVGLVNPTVAICRGLTGFYM